MVVVILASISAVAWIFYDRPHPWTVDQVPIAFWAWRTRSPSDVDVQTAIEKTKVRTIFLRAGQIDYRNENLRRIRSLSGELPKEIDLHLVYNATPALLKQLERVEEKLLASVIARAYKEDVERWSHGQSRIVGIQIDLDFPTRLLRRCTAMLSALRGELRQDTQLSITGLPTWIESSELSNALRHVDFWIPQMYGSEVPRRADNFIPITSLAKIEYFINKTRILNRPFFAGLASYSWALLYSKTGSLITMRGDLDLNTIASNSNLELVEQRTKNKPISAANTDSLITSEWRYTFRARAEGVLSDLAMSEGDLLVIYLPTTESLRAAARIVRQLAGKKLLGICIFRLPTPEDTTTLTLDQVSAALSDRDPTALVDINIRRPNALLTDSSKWLVEIKNLGTSSPVIGTLLIDLALPSGSFKEFHGSSPITLRTLCKTGPSEFSPCSARHANLIRFSARMLTPGQTLKLHLFLTQNLPVELPVSVKMQTDYGSVYANQQIVTVETESAL